MRAYVPRMNETGLLALIAVTYYVVALILLARCSHWAHQTQQKLDVTNRMLWEILQRQSGAAAPPYAPQQGNPGSYVGRS